jgi:hypothetical protein
MNRVIKFFLNDKMALLWAIFVEIIVHGIFALGALLFGAFLGELILVHLFGPIGEQVGAWLFALFIFCAAFQAFVLGEYTRDQVKAYERSGMGDGSYYKSWQYNRWLVGSLELSSLLFRCYITSKDGDLVQAGSSSSSASWLLSMPSFRQRLSMPASIVPPRMMPTVPRRV